MVCLCLSKSGRVKEKRGLISWRELGLLKPYDIVQTAPGTLVAEFFFTSTFSLSLLIHQKANIDL